MITIGGAALGAFLANNQMKVVKATVRGLGQCFKGSKYTKARYMELMALLYDILQKARKEGLMSIEKDVEDPHNSPLFQKYPTVGNDHHVIGVHHRLPAHDGLGQPERARDRKPDGQRDRDPPPRRACRGGRHRSAWPARLPAFGIVAAVLGVVNTMGSVGQPPAVLGGMIGSALVGTFLGILLAYAFAEPLAGLLEQKVEDAGKELQCIKTTLLASMQGYAPQVAIEFGRKVLYSTDAPDASPSSRGHVKRQEG